ncbi:hypothetical protein V6330_24850, partial [Citrobacter portucalensis]
AAPSAKGDDKFITTDYLQQCLIFRMLVFSLIKKFGKKDVNIFGRELLIIFSLYSLAQKVLTT